MTHLAVAFVLLVVLFMLCRQWLSGPSWWELGGMLVIGAGVGMLLDFTLGYKVGWWYYLHHSWYSWDYFAFLIPAWAMMVTLFILFYKLLEHWIANPIVRLTLYYSLIPLEQEFMGVVGTGWAYTANPALIGIGWILLLNSCVVIKLSLDWLKRPVEVKA